MTRRFFSLIIVCSLLLPVLGGCDFLRRVAGRPTSSDIEAKTEFIACEQAAAMAREEAAARERKRVADSIALMDSLSRSNTVVSGRELAHSLEARYYVIVGSFGKESNASAFARKTEAAGYPATLIAYKNGFTAVGICPSHDIAGAAAALRKVRQESFCPAGAWILNNE